MINKEPLVYFKNIFDLLPEPVLVLNKTELKIKLCNLESQSLFEKSNDYLFEKSLDQVLTNNSVIVSNIKEAVKKYGNFIIKDKVSIKDTYFQLKCVVSEELGGEFIMIFNEVQNNENKFLDQNLEFFNEIFSILSHEVNNPISSIKLASDLIKKRYVNVDSELLEIIKSEALSITRLFNNFNLTDSKNLSKKTQENIHELIRLSLFKIKQMPNKLKIIEEFDPSLPMIRINRDLIIQALDNLLINAYESSNFSSNSFLKVQTRFIVGESIKIPNLKNYIKKNSLSINISENGVGIKQDLLEKIFLPFFSTKKRGSGIGLFLVKKIIDDHEGSIDIESSGGITSLKIILPF